MRRRSDAIIMGLICCLCIAAAGRSGALYMSAKRSFAATELAVTEMSHQAREILRLRKTQQQIELNPRPAQDLIARVNAAMSEAGVSQRHFKSLNPESDADVPLNIGQQTMVRRQTVRLSLQNLEPTELGRFLGEWRASNPIWQPMRIDLTHSGNAKSQENRYDVVLLLSALYLGEQESA